MLPLFRNVPGSRQGTSECNIAEKCSLLPRHCTSPATLPHSVQLKGGRSTTQVAAHTRWREGLSQEDLPRLPTAGSDRGYDGRMPSSRAVGSSDWVTTSDLDEDLEDEDILYELTSESTSATAAAPALPDQTNIPGGARTQVC